MVGSRGSVTLGVAATARSIATTSEDTANIALNAESAVTVISSNSPGSMVSARLSTLKISNNEVSAPMRRDIGMNARDDDGGKRRRIGADGGGPELIER